MDTGAPRPPETIYIPKASLYDHPIRSTQGSLFPPRTEHHVLADTTQATYITLKQQDLCKPPLLNYDHPAYFSLPTGVSLHDLQLEDGSATTPTRVIDTMEQLARFSLNDGPF